MTKRILVVEDDPIGRKILVDSLTARGYIVSSARTGPEGLQKARDEQPHLVVCDVLLPQKSGFEVCFEIKRSVSTCDMPVILMSAVCKDTHSEFYASVDLKADGYFVKPFAMAAMLARIQDVLVA